MSAQKIIAKVKNGHVVNVIVAPDCIWPGRRLGGHWVEALPGDNHPGIGMEYAPDRPGRFHAVVPEDEETEEI